MKRICNEFEAKATRKAVRKMLWHELGLDGESGGDGERGAVFRVLYLLALA